VLLIAGVILLAVLLVAAIVAIATTVSHRGRAAAGPGRHVDHVVTGPALDGRRAATLDLVSGATSVTVHGGDLGDRLYRVTTPDSSNLAPAVVDQGGADNVVQVQLNNVTGNGASAVVIELNRDVRWQVRLTAGATTESLDLHDVKLAGVDFIGGASNIDLTLGEPSGTLAIHQGGGVNHFGIHTPPGTPVRVTAGGGAGTITIDGTQHSGIAGGTTFASTGWSAATDRYDVVNNVGVGSLIADHVG
jgi:hypothetical protein